jgi:FdhE protein
LSTASETWLEAHPYLRRVSDLCALVERAAAESTVPPAADPDFDGYRGDYLAGVPLLKSSRPLVDLEPAGQAAAALVRRVASEAGESGMREDAGALDAALRAEPEPGGKIAGWLLEADDWSPPAPGLLRYAGWTAAARYLRPLLHAFALWRDEERWQRRWCPTCGSPPCMAQLSEIESARVRWLCCGRCRSRWQFPRTKCPFCEADTQKLSILSVEGEGGLRIDWCESCRGYLKTYAGQGNESVMLEDWTSLHLDLAAQERGLERSAGSLYDLRLSRSPSSPAR